MNPLIYLNEPAVNEELIAHHGGELEETIERISSNTSIGGEVGAEASDPSGLFAKLKAAITANWERGKEKEFIYNLSDEVAKFTLLLEVLDESGATQIDEKFSTANRDDLTSSAPIMITAPLTLTPIEEIKNKLDIGEAVGGMAEAFRHIEKSGLFESGEFRELREDFEDLDHASTGAEKFFTSLTEIDNLYRTNTSSEVDFIMELPEQHFRNRPIDFPSPTKRYVILANIRTKIERGDNIQLIPFAELAEKSTTNPRELKTEELQIKRDVADMANDILNERKISGSEFELSYPDVQVQPLAIY